MVLLIEGETTVDDLDVTGTFTFSGDADPNDDALHKLRMESLDIIGVPGGTTVIVRDEAFLHGTNPP